MYIVFNLHISEALYNLLLLSYTTFSKKEDLCILSSGGSSGPMVELDIIQEDHS